MVKRKAESCWVNGPEEGVISSELRSADVTAEQGRSIAIDFPSVEGIPPGLTAKPVANGAVDVAGREGSEPGVFWLLLGLAGYEDW